MSNQPMIEPGNEAFAKDILEGVAFVRAFEQKALELSRGTPQEIVGSWSTDRTLLNGRGSTSAPTFDISETQNALAH